MSSSPDPDADPLLTEAEAAAVTRLSVRTMQNHRYAGSGPRHHRLGRTVRYRRSDLAAWLNANATAGGRA